MTSRKPQGVLISRGDEHGGPLTEVSVARVALHWNDSGFVIVSAFRGARRVEGSTWEQRNAENIRWDTRLRAAIRSAGFGYIPLMGYWYEPTAAGGKERVREFSHLVPAQHSGKPVPVDAMTAHAIAWGNLDPRLPQESVIVAAPGGPVTFYDPTTGHAVGSVPTFSANRVADIYSRIRGKAHGTFVFEGWYWAVPPDSFGGAAARAAQGESFFIKS